MRLHVRPGESPRSPTSTLLWTAVASLAYTAAIVGYSLLPSTNAVITAPLWQTIGVSLLGSLGTVGVPVALWRRYGLLAPVAVMAFVLLFWHVLVEFGLVGSGQGDSPVFLFVILLAPGYVVLYAISGAIERWLRSRGSRRPSGEQTG